MNENPTISVEESDAGDLLEMIHRQEQSIREMHRTLLALQDQERKELHIRSQLQIDLDNHTNSKSKHLDHMPVEDLLSSGEPHIEVLRDGDSEGGGGADPYPTDPDYTLRELDVVATTPNGDAAIRVTADGELQAYYVRILVAVKPYDDTGDSEILGQWRAWHQALGCPTVV